MADDRKDKQADRAERQDGGDREGGVPISFPL